MDIIQRRIEKAIGCCKDCETIPKVKNAGKVIGEHQIMHNGLKIIKGCYHGNLMTPIIEGSNGHHEPQEEKAFYEVLKHIKNGSTMIEVGSWWAYYSMWFNKEIKDAKNYMIDVNEQLLNIGKVNFKINNLSGKFFIGEVPKLDFTKFLKENTIEFVDILHCDIQGWEYHLLLECEKHLDKIGYIFISTHTDQHTSGKHWGSPKEMLHEDCLKFLIDHNFIILCEHNMVESASHDGLIVAKNPLVSPEFDKIKISKCI